MLQTGDGHNWGIIYHQSGYGLEKSSWLRSNICFWGLKSAASRIISVHCVQERGERPADRAMIRAARP